MARYVLTESQRNYLFDRLNEEYRDALLEIENQEDDDIEKTFSDEIETELLPQNWGKNKKLKKKDIPPNTIRFSQTGNAKIAHPSFSLPSGHSCPYAKDCKSMADPITGEITDCGENKIRCFSASQEALFPPLRKMRWENYTLLQQHTKLESLTNLIDRSFNLYFPNGIPVMRLHIGGDFYSNVYFLAWVMVAKKHPRSLFYAYTKSLPFWIRHKDLIPSNFKLKASKGGTKDKLIDKHGLPSATVVFSPEEADQLGLQIDTNDDLAAFGDDSLALLLHGTQPAGSEANIAVQKLKKLGHTGYGKKSSNKLDEEIRRFKELI